MIGETKVEYAANANLNQAQNTALLTYIAMKPCVIQRFGVMANSANGLLAANELKVRVAPAVTGTAADSAVGTLDVAANRTRGVIVYKDAEARVEVAAGDTITVCSEVAAGGTSTGDVFLEIQELSFMDKPTTAVASA